MSAQRTVTLVACVLPARPLTVFSAARFTTLNSSPFVASSAVVDETNNAEEAVNGASPNCALMSAEPGESACMCVSDVASTKTTAGLAEVSALCALTSNALGGSSSRKAVTRARACW